MATYMIIHMITYMATYMRLLVYMIVAWLARVASFLMAFNDDKILWFIYQWYMNFDLYINYIWILFYDDQLPWFAQGRSVCGSWRENVPPYPHLLLLKKNLFGGNGDDDDDDGNDNDNDDDDDDGYDDMTIMMTMASVFSGAVLTKSRHHMVVGTDTLSNALQCTDLCRM